MEGQVHTNIFPSDPRWRDVSRIDHNLHLVVDNFRRLSAPDWLNAIRQHPVEEAIPDIKHWLAQIFDLIQTAELDPQEEYEELPPNHPIYIITEGHKHQEAWTALYTQDGTSSWENALEQMQGLGEVVREKYAIIQTLVGLCRTRLDRGGYLDVGREKIRRAIEDVRNAALNMRVNFPELLQHHQLSLNEVGNSLLRGTQDKLLVMYDLFLELYDLANKIVDLIEILNDALTNPILERL